MREKKFLLYEQEIENKQIEDDEDEEKKQKCAAQVSESVVI